MRTFIRVVSCALLLSSSGIHAVGPAKGSLDGNSYRYEPLNWSFVLPDSWSVRTMAEVDRVRNVGKTLVEDTLNEDIPLTPTPVIYLQSGTNKFTSDVSRYVPESDKTYLQTLEEVRSVIVSTLESKGLEFQTQGGKQVIDGVTFETFDLYLLSPDRKKVLMTSVMFDAVINDYDFGMSYTCIDKTECKKIKHAIANSKF